MPVTAIGPSIGVRRTSETPLPLSNTPRHPPKNTTPLMQRASPSAGTLVHAPRNAMIEDLESRKARGGSHKDSDENRGTSKSSGCKAVVGADEANTIYTIRNSDNTFCAKVAHLALNNCPVDFLDPDEETKDAFRPPNRMVQYDWANFGFTGRVSATGAFNDSLDDCIRDQYNTVSTDYFDSLSKGWAPRAAWGAIDSVGIAATTMALYLGARGVAALANKVTNSCTGSSRQGHGDGVEEAIEMGSVSSSVNIPANGNGSYATRIFDWMETARGKLIGTFAAEAVVAGAAAGAGGFGLAPGGLSGAKVANSIGTAALGYFTTPLIDAGVRRVLGDRTALPSYAYMLAMPGMLAESVGKKIKAKLGF
jgi:hypothetical protein